MKHFFALHIVAALLLGGCFQRPLVPPLTAATLASAEAIGEGQTAVGGNVGGHGAVFGPGATSAGVRVRHGLTEELELNVDGGVYVVTGDEVAEHRGIYTARLGLKYQLADWVALAAGLGGGLAPATGPLLGADLSAIFAAENDHFVFFFAPRVAYTAPVRPGTIDVINGDDTVAIAPDDTWGLTLEAGARVPVGRFLRGVDGKLALTPTGHRRRRANILFSGAVTRLSDGRGGVLEESDHLWFFGFVTGVEVRLDP